MKKQTEVSVDVKKIIYLTIEEVEDIVAKYLNCLGNCDFRWTCYYGDVSGLEVILKQNKDFVDGINKTFNDTYDWTSKRRKIKKLENMEF